MGVSAADGDTVWNANYNTAVGPAESLMGLIDYDMSDMVPKMTIGLGGPGVERAERHRLSEGEIDYAFIPQLKLPRIWHVGCRGFRLRR